MNKFALIFGIIVLIALGGVTALAFSDVPQERQAVTKTIPNERFFASNDR